MTLEMNIQAMVDLHQYGRKAFYGVILLFLFTLVICLELREQGLENKKAIEILMLQKEEITKQLTDEVNNRQDMINELNQQINSLDTQLQQMRAQHPKGQWL